MTVPRVALACAPLLIGALAAMAQDEVLVNKVGTKLGPRSAFLKDCHEQWARSPELSIFEQARFCECMLPIVLTAPAVAQSRNAKVLDAIELEALLDNSPTAFDELAKCTGLDIASVRLGSMGEEFVRAFRQGCADELGREPTIANSGADARKLCDCMVDAVVSRNLTIGDLQTAMNPNSPLFNEVFLPCSNEAMPATSAYHDPLRDLSGPETPVTVPVISMGKVHKVKVNVGGTDQYFIIDSGAEDCIISEAFRKELQAAGAIDTVERLTQREYLIADGSRVTYQRHLLNGMRIGPFTVDRVVAASIDQNIQYLLGKSFLNKFKTWRIDEQGKELTLQR